MRRVKLGNSKPTLSTFVVYLRAPACTMTCYKRGSYGGLTAVVSVANGGLRYSQDACRDCMDL